MCPPGWLVIRLFLLIFYFNWGINSDNSVSLSEQILLNQRDLRRSGHSCSRLWFDKVKSLIFWFIWRIHRIFDQITSEDMIIVIFLLLFRSKGSKVLVLRIYHFSLRLLRSIRDCCQTGFGSCIEHILRYSFQRIDAVKRKHVSTH